ncbi:flavin-nucleotide-binding protein [Crucibulum laeve]|uniref:Flavin-nucleotide-binding protein n=1 Tax=Crucibulum laeve TaxID=68775 RepID=A0A5C3MCP8_9AGAR|nr:flavin-nucleotide-binding protein [Crucibulum laeve]
MSELEEYQKTPRSTVNRLKKRAVYDHDTVHNIIDSVPVLHVSFVPVSLEDDPFPATLPMLGCTGSFTSESPDAVLSIYLHGYVSSRLMKLPASNVSEEELPGTPVCIAATHLDGLVLALTPFHHSCNYRSAIVHGWAHIVTNSAEKIYALERITDNMLSNRWENTRVPPTKAEMDSTGVLRVDIVSASAKVRAGGPSDDRPDLKDEELTQRVWTGVVPSWIQYGEPIPGPNNHVGSVPDYITKWVQWENEKNGRQARDAVFLEVNKK